MPKTSFKTFKPDTFLTGAAYSLCNSFDLFNDGILLLRNGRLCRAYTLFQLSMEEAGKTMLLLDGFVIFKIYENVKGLKDFKNLNNNYALLDKVFYNHPEKMKYAMKHELRILNGFIKHFNTSPGAGISHQRDQLEEDLKIVNELNNMKNYSLYTFVEGEKIRTTERQIRY